MAGKPASRADLTQGEVKASAHGSARPFRMPASFLDAGIGVLMLAIALWFWLEAGAIETDSRGLMGPLAFPEAISAMLGLCAVLMIARGLAPLRLARISVFVTVERPWFVLLAMGMVIIYPLLMSVLNYYLATAIWLPPFLWVAGYRKPLGIAFATVGFLIFTRIVFQQLLGTPMP